MKIRIYGLAMILVFACASVGHAEEYSKIRALERRAAVVLKLKNDFVTKVLASYTIPYERNMQGTVVRINMDGNWLDVSAIDIVPVLRETTDKRPQVAAHELIFSTAGGTLDLLSELMIR